MTEDYSEAALLRRAREANEQWDRMWQEHQARWSEMVAGLLLQQGDADVLAEKQKAPVRGSQ